MKKYICFFIANLKVSGAELVIINLANEFSKHGYKTDLVLCLDEGPLRKYVSDSVRIVNLSTRSVVLSILKFAKYLRINNPDAVISALGTVNIIALLAKYIGHNGGSKIIITIHNPLPQYYHEHKLIRAKCIPIIATLIFRLADHVVAVSEGLKKEFIDRRIINNDIISVVYNPVISQEFFKKSNRKIDFEWFNEKDRIPIIISLGRLTRQKNYDLLISAFKKVCEIKPCRLIIIGEGEERGRLERLIRHFGIGDRVYMPGIMDNPYPYIKNSDLFVLSSRWEGCGNVLIEAMALEVPVISTDCQFGPDEILRGGTLGILVNIDDIDMLSNAMLEVIMHKYRFDTKTAFEDVTRRFSNNVSFNHYEEVVKLLL